MGRGESDPNKQREQPKGKRAERRAAQRRAAQQAAAKKDQRSLDSEQWNRRLIIGSVVAVVIVAIGFIAFGWYQTQIRPLGKTVLRVEDREYTLAHLERRMALELDRGFPREELLSLPESVLFQLEGEAALLAGIHEFGLEVTDEDVAAEIRSRGGLADDVEPEVFADAMRRQVRESGLRQSEYELMIRAFLAEQKVIEHFGSQALSQEPQARGQLMILTEEEDAITAVERFEAGEDFLAVAEELSLDPLNVEVDWFVRGGRPFIFEEVEDFFFTGQPGTRSDIIEINNFYYIVNLLERDEARELDEDQRNIVANRDVRLWIDGLRETLNIERDFTREDSIKALSDIL